MRRSIFDRDRCTLLTAPYPFHIHNPPGTGAGASAGAGAGFGLASDDGGLRCSERSICTHPATIKAMSVTAVQIIGLLIFYPCSAASHR